MSGNRTWPVLWCCLAHQRLGPFGDEGPLAVAKARMRGDAEGLKSETPACSMQSGRPDLVAAANRHIA